MITTIIINHYYLVVIGISFIVIAVIHVIFIMIIVFDFG